MYSMHFRDLICFVSYRGRRGGSASILQVYVFALIKLLRYSLNIVNISYDKLVFTCILYLYSNIPSNAIVNAASKIIYRPLIQTDVTGQCLRSSFYERA
jgi:hypothetical protein